MRPPAPPAESPASPAPASASVPAASSGASSHEPAAGLVALVKPPPGARADDGIAVALLVDTSSSMMALVVDTDGVSRSKLDVAKRACRSLIAKLEEFAAESPTRPLKFGFYQFSGDSCEALLPMGTLDPAALQAAVDSLAASTGTPIGEAILTAKRDLDRSGLSRRHMLLVTDGQNTQGRDPVEVARAIASLPCEEQAGIHFVAFQVEAAQFQGIREAGGTVLEARDPAELNARMDYILQKKILAEMPEADEPPERGK